MNAQKVYAIASDRGFVKIGRSNDPDGRCAALRNQNPSDNLRLAHVAECPSFAPNVEKIAHQLLDAVRVKGEWFSATINEAIEAIQMAIEIVEGDATVPHEGRVSWTARISVPPPIQKALRKIAEEERVSVAYLIGNALTEFVTARSS